MNSRKYYWKLWISASKRTLWLKYVSINVETIRIYSFYSVIKTSQMTSNNSLGENKIFITHKRERATSELNSWTKQQKELNKNKKASISFERHLLFTWSGDWTRFLHLSSFSNRLELRMEWEKLMPLQVIQRWMRA